MAGLKLYELAQDYRDVESKLMAAVEAQEAGDVDAAEMSEVWRDTLEGIEGTIQEKIDNIVMLIREKKAEAEAIKAERQRLEKRQRAAEHAEDRLRAYISWAMDSTGIGRLKSAVATVTLAEGKPKVVIQDFDRFLESDYRDAFWRLEKRESDIDKAALKESIEQGNDVPGVVLVSDKVLTIR